MPNPSIVRLTFASVAALFAVAPLRAQTERPDAAPQQPAEPVKHASHPRFFVLDAPDDPLQVRAHLEDLVRRTGVARVARSRQEADYLLAPDVQVESELSDQDHMQNVEVEYYNEKGEKKKKTQERKAHTDDVLRVTTRLTCGIVKIDPEDRRQEIARVAGTVTRTSGGPDAPGHRADDSPIRIRRSQVRALEARLATISGTSAESALARRIVNLCRVQGPVMEIDRKANRITVGLGSEDGIQPKEFPGGVTEMDLYARTGHLAEYTYEDPGTGTFYTVDRKSASARPDSPSTWVYLEEDVPQGTRRRALTGPDVKTLIPLGERVDGWAEVQELGADSCTVALKRKGDFGRTVDDTKALARIPDLQTTQVVARVRGKRGSG